MSYADLLRDEGTLTTTENGAVAFNTTKDACLDLFGTIGSLRNADKTRIETLFAEACKEDTLLATKIAFYARDIREGLGERETFRTLIKYMAENHPECLEDNLDLIGVYGRYDDLYSLIGTPLEDKMWDTMKTQFEEDKKNMEEGKSISLLAKWIKTADASSKETKRLGIMTAKKLGYEVYDFKRLVRSMRKEINVVESYMSKGEWDKIKYSEVPSRAMMIYRNAFLDHDGKRFEEFTNNAVKGEEKINSGTLYPYDIVEKILYNEEDSDILEAQWKQLPNYVEEGTNALVIADVSGSMYGRPMATSIGLATYFAERNTGAYHDMFMTFSEKPKVEILKGETLNQKIRNLRNADWGMNTNLEAAFEKVLDIAVKNDVPQEEMVKSLIVVSDMEIDECTKGSNRTWSFYNEMKDRFKEAGYDIPNVVFWNVDSRNNVFHADKDRKGVQLCSGQSATTFKQLVGAINLTPMEFMDKVINSERYEPIKLAGEEIDIENKKDISDKDIEELDNNDMSEDIEEDTPSYEDDDMEL